MVAVLFKGRSNKEIADESCISEETVKKHIQNIYRKAGVKNRASLVHTFQLSRNS
jgi:DNA-binding NarL/FixJ family response regulator